MSNSKWRLTLSVLLSCCSVNANATLEHGQESSLASPRVTSTVQSPLGSNIGNYIDSAYKESAKRHFLLGVELLSAANTEQQFSLAREQFEKAAALGSPESMHNLGVIYQQGFGVKENADLAIEWFEKAGSKGLSESIFNLGRMYEKGILVAKNPNKAADYYQRAMNLQNSKAMSNLGVLYATGRGVPVDRERAFMLFCQSAQRGDLKGLENFALALKNGFGTEKNNKNERIAEIFLDFVNEKRRQMPIESDRDLSMFAFRERQADALYLDVSSLFTQSVRQIALVEPDRFCDPDLN